MHHWKLCTALLALLQLVAICRCDPCNCHHCRKVSIQALRCRCCVVIRNGKRSILETPYPGYTLELIENESHVIGDAVTNTTRSLRIDRDRDAANRTTGATQQRRRSGLSKTRVSVTTQNTRLKALNDTRREQVQMLTQKLKPNAFGDRRNKPWNLYGPRDEPRGRITRARARLLDSKSKQSDSYYSVHEPRRPPNVDSHVPGDLWDSTRVQNKENHNKHEHRNHGNMHKRRRLHDLNPRSMSLPVFTRKPRLLGEPKHLPLCWQGVRRVARRLIEPRHRQLSQQDPKLRSMRLLEPEHLSVGWRGVGSEDRILFDPEQYEHNHELNNTAFDLFVRTHSLHPPNTRFNQ